MVAHTGFEPVISALRGQCPRPLDECATKKPAVVYHAAALNSSLARA
jgi:hypothetical protein